jgi:hypothetical protein
MKESGQAKEKREERKSKVSTISFFICLGISIVLMVGGAIVPPPFVIDATIFKAVGWLFGFAALGQLPAILDADKWAKISHGNTTVIVGDKDDMDRNRHIRVGRGGYMEYDSEPEPDPITEETEEVDEV